MSNYCLSIVRNLNRNDGLTKPKSDINSILKQNDFIEIRQKVYNSRAQKIFSANKNVKNILEQMKSGDLLVVNYPTDMGPIFDRCLLEKLKRKKIKSVAIIHDIDALRFQVPYRKRLKTEVNLLNKYTCVIAPNKVMLKHLQLNGLIVPATTLKLFDYLTKQDMSNKKVEYAPVVSFTGNLNKARFIYGLKNTHNVHYELYGPIDTDIEKISSMYKGSFDSEDLLLKVNKGFGLIWDGVSTETIDTSEVSSGSYLLYNNPYKLSFYIAAGIPIVIWDQAAESQFVVEKGIGITIKSLDDLDNLIGSISENQFKTMQRNVKEVQQYVLGGKYTKQAIKNVFDICVNN